MLHDIEKWTINEGRINGKGKHGGPKRQLDRGTHGEIVMTTTEARGTAKKRDRILTSVRGTTSSPRLSNEDI